MNATTDLGRREQEARRIAREDGHSIIGASEDWTSFCLADDLPDEKADAIWRTCFTWNEFRFEGFVTDVAVHA